MAFLEGKFEYKGYIIQPSVVCFDLRYFVFGDGFTFNHYKDICDAKKAIDKYITKKCLNNLIENISREIGVDKNLMIECFKEMVME